MRCGWIDVHYVFNSYIIPVRLRELCNMLHCFAVTLRVSKVILLVSYPFLLYRYNMLYRY